MEALGRSLAAVQPYDVLSLVPKTSLLRFDYHFRPLLCMYCTSGFALTTVSLLWFGFPPRSLQFYVRVYNPCIQTGLALG